MTNFIADFSPRNAAASLRVLYPLFFVFGIFSMMIATINLVVAGDAATTAKNIMDNESLFRAGIAGSMIVNLIHIAVALVLYVLFKSVNKNMASLMVVFTLVGAPISMLGELNKVAALAVLNGPDPSLAQMMLFIDMGAMANLGIAGIFWGLWLLPLGYLVYKSGYFPRFIGILLVVGGFGFLLDAFSALLFSGYDFYDAVLAPVAAILATPGELIFMLWLVFKGTKMPGDDEEAKLEQSSSQIA